MRELWNRDVKPSVPSPTAKAPRRSHHGNFYPFHHPTQCFIIAKVLVKWLREVIRELVEPF